MVLSRIFYEWVQYISVLSLKTFKGNNVFMHKQTQINSKDKHFEWFNKDISPKMQFLHS